MGKATGFMEYERLELPLRYPAERVKDYAPLQLPVSDKNRRRQSGRCMDCGVPFCQAGVQFEGQFLGCPLHNLIPEWNALLYSGNYPAALARLLKTNCFPEFTGRVCPALCERACTCGMIGQSVTIHDNERAIIDYAFDNDLMQPVLPAAHSGKTVAVVGSGPAGLAAAYYLNRRGHQVTVFERDSVPGGLLSYGIAPMKLPQAVVERRVRLMQDEGVSFQTNCDVGRDVSAAFLQGFDLVIFACGAQKPRALSWPTQAKSGVYYALDFLKAASEARLEGLESEITAKGKPVVIVGAGDSASDCVAICLRQGCRDIHQLIRRPASSYPGALDYAHEESQAVFGRDIRRFETQIEDLVCGEDGGLAAVRTVAGETLEAQLLIIASGFSGCEDYALDAYEALKAAGVPVLQAGDMACGASLVVHAIASGKKAAAEADRRLMGYTNIL